MSDRNKAIAVAAAIVIIALTAEAATYYMTIDSVTAQSSGPYTKDQYSIVLSVTYSAPGGVSATNCRARLSSLPSGWSVLDNYNTNYKSLSGCSGTTTFEIMPTTSGSYGGSTMIVEVAGTDSSGENTLNAGTKSPSGTFVVQSQPVLSLVSNVTNVTNISAGSQIPVSYEITNTGDAATASTQNLRLVVSSTPLGGLLFENNMSSTTIGSGVIAPGAKVTGTVVLVPRNTTSNTISFTLTANADNTVQTSTTAARTVSCNDCAVAATIDVMLRGGWNLISIPVQI